MATVRKFLFDTAFEEEAPVGPGEPEPPQAPSPEPTFGEADLEAARAEGYARGHADGEAAMLASAEHQAAEALQQIARGCQAALAELDEATTRALDHGARAGCLVVARAMPTLSDRVGRDEILALLKRALANLGDEPRVVVRLADEQLDDLSPAIESAAHQSGYPGRVITLADASVARGDCRIEWADGGMVRDTGRLISEARTLVGQLIGDAADTDDCPADAPADSTNPAATEARS